MRQFGAAGQGHQGPIAGRNQHVPGVRAPGYRAQDQPGRQIGRHVLHAVHGQIHPAFHQGLFDFFYKKPLAADFGKGHIQYFVAFGFNSDQFDLDFRQFFV